MFGWLSAVKNVITGTGKGAEIASKTADGLIAGFDKMAFTQEEKFDAWKDVAKVHLEMVKASADESSAKSITRRILALILIGDYVLLTTVACLIYKIDPKWSVYIIEATNNTVLGKLTLWFGIFYVGYYGVSTILEKAKK